MAEKQIQALKKQLQQVNELHLERETYSSSEFVRWREATKRRIKRIFGEESKHLEKFNSINYISLAFVGDEYTQRRIDQEAFLGGLEVAKTRLLVMIDELVEYAELGELQSAWEIVSVEEEQSVASLIQVLRRFRECCQHLTHLPDGEKDVQDILWIMLRSRYDSLEREETLPRFGVKSYRPDFGLPDLRAVIEVKFIGAKTEVSGSQEGILADVPGYLNSATDYDAVIVFVYDGAHKLRDCKKFVRDLESVEGIAGVMVTPGLG